MGLCKKLLCACALAMAAALSAFAEECVVIRPGEVDVVLPAKPLPIERFAASEMTNFLSRVLGAPVPVRASPGAVPARAAILLGRATGFDVSAFDRDAFKTKVESFPDGRIEVRIAGRDMEGPFNPAKDWARGGVRRRGLRVR